MPRCRDLAIFVVTTTDRQTDYFTPAHAGGVITLPLVHARGIINPVRKALDPHVHVFLVFRDQPGFR